ncbi:MAG TPA: GNAT family N-acetyltransferase [Nocardioides sp.]|uniref:GNAT family N-acetyltransferase n=1 Tax=Nocardioides sp. TaxID=35761 RepID=UPI002ED7E521
METDRGIRPEITALTRAEVTPAFAQRLAQLDNAAADDRGLAPRTSAEWLGRISGPRDTEHTLLPRRRHERPEPEPMVWLVRHVPQHPEHPRHPEHPADSPVPEPEPLTPAEAIGYASLLPVPGQPHAAAVQVAVLPAQRRAGLGSRLLRCALQHARTHGLSELRAVAWHEAEGEAFLQAHGFAEAHQRHAVRRLDLSRSAERRQRMAADVAPYGVGYELSRVAGPAADDLVAELALLLDDAEPAGRWTRRLVYDMENRLLARGTVYRVLARHGDTGRLAGMTTLYVAPDTPDFARHEELVVAPAHRGHRLGLLMMLDMVAWLAEVEPRVGVTQGRHVADSTRLIGINDRLGSRVAGREVGYRRELD